MRPVCRGALWDGTLEHTSEPLPTKVYLQEPLEQNGFLVPTGFVICLNFCFLVSVFFFLRGVNMQRHFDWKKNKNALQFTWIIVMKKRVCLSKPHPPLIS